MEAMALQGTRFTRADYDRIPEDVRVELIGGALLKMASPTVDHQELVSVIHHKLFELLGRGRIFCGPIDFAIDDQNVLVPDVVALPKRPDSGARDIWSASLVVEILSPSTAARDRVIKTDLYLAAGVREVWLIDARKKAIELRTQAGLSIFGVGDTVDSEAVPGFQLELADLFGG